jgi:hypothetical protein
LALFSLTLGIGFSLVVGAPPEATVCVEGLRAASPAYPRAGRVAFLGTGLSVEDTMVFTSALAAAKHPGVVLIDNPKSTPYTRAFLESFEAEHVVPVGPLPNGTADLEERLGRTVTLPLAWKHGRPTGLWRSLFPRAARVVVCSSGSPRLLLRSAYLAGIVQAPLFVLHGETSEEAELRRWCAEWQTREIIVAGTAAEDFDLAGFRVTRLESDDQLAKAALHRLVERGHVTTLVIANPADSDRNLGSMSSLAPWVALRRHASLLLTNDAGTDTAAIVKTALRRHELRRADNVVIVAGLDAVPMDQRGNPAPGKDDYIEMEPLTPKGAEPFSFALGRLFHHEPSMVMLMLARARLLENAGPRKALVVSNAGSSLPLLEAFSRSTARELQNTGYETTTLFGHDVSKDTVRRLLPEHDIFLWEGHHNTLIKEYGFREWSEPLPPSLFVLQSCLALTESKALPPLHRGAVGVIGSSTRTYSASGGAFTLAFFNALQYEGQSLGEAMRHSKNFLLAYAQLKEKRLTGKAKLTGANQRTAWAFTLWGDPTLTLPAPVRSDAALASVSHRVDGNNIVVNLPGSQYDNVVTSKYRAQMRPNARLAGLLQRDENGDGRSRLVPLAFAEVKLPAAPTGKVPRLATRVPDRDWVFLWDRRRQCGYLLVAPAHAGEAELHFRVHWDTPAVVEASELADAAAE